MKQDKSQEHSSTVVEEQWSRDFNFRHLVNNVDIEVAPSPIRSVSKEEFLEIFEPNVFGPVYLTKIFSQKMINKLTKGSIIFITFIHQDTLRVATSYSSSKTALTMVIKELAMELRPFHIRVNGVRPRWVQEDKNGNALHHKLTPIHENSINRCYIERGATN